MDASELINSNIRQILFTNVPKECAQELWQLLGDSTGQTSERDACRPMGDSGDSRWLISLKFAAEPPYQVAQVADWCKLLSEMPFGSFRDDFPGGELDAIVLAVTVDTELAECPHVRILVDREGVRLEKLTRA